MITNVIRVGGTGVISIIGVTRSYFFVEEFRMVTTRSLFQKCTAAFFLAAIFSAAPVGAMGERWARPSGWHQPHHHPFGWAKPRPNVACHPQANAELRSNRNETRDLAIKVAVIATAVAAVGACCHFFGGPSRVFPQCRARVNLPGGVPLDLGFGAEFDVRNRGRRGGR